MGAPQPSIASAELLLGLHRDVLASLITKREDTRIGKSTGGALIENRPAEAVVMLESLCRIIYGRTFKHCLYQCSVKSFVRSRQSIDQGGGEYMAAVAGGADSRAELHLVDMPGWVTQFEAGTAAASSSASSSSGTASAVASMVGHLQHLLQNYMEERVHEEYLRAVFQQELQVYRSEGVSLDDTMLMQLPFDESEPMKEFFERPVTGLISLLEEACQAIKPDDRSLVSKILVTHLKTKVECWLCMIASYECCLMQPMPYALSSIDLLIDLSIIYLLIYLSIVVDKGGWVSIQRDGVRHPPLVR